MIFMNRMLLVYDPNQDQMKATKFAQQVLILGAQFKGHTNDHW